MTHHATAAFWESYARLPLAIQQLADKNFELLKADPDHPSLHFKKVGSYRSVRIGIAFGTFGCGSVRDGRGRIGTQKTPGFLGKTRGF
jgi:hypothetical protein